MARSETAGTGGTKAGADDADAEITTVYLGNRDVISITSDGDRLKTPGKYCTTVKIPADTTLMAALQDITGPQGLWQAHSDAPGPAWVAAEGPLGEALTQFLAAHYKADIREPEPATEG